MPLGSTLEQAKVGLKAAIKDLHKCRTRAAELRSNFIDERVEAAALAEDTTVDKMLKKLKHGEAQTKCFGKLAHTLKPAGAWPHRSPC
jgi:hypothetical protein